MDSSNIFATNASLTNNSSIEDVMKKKDEKAENELQVLLSIGLIILLGISAIVAVVFIGQSRKEDPDECTIDLDCKKKNIGKNVCIRTTKGNKCKECRINEDCSDNLLCDNNLFKCTTKQCGAYDTVNESDCIENNLEKPGENYDCVCSRGLYKWRKQI